MTALQTHVCGWLGRKVYHVVVLCAIFWLVITMVNQVSNWATKPKIQQVASRKELAELLKAKKKDFNTDVDCYLGYMGNSETTEVMRNRSQHASEACKAAGLHGRRRIHDLANYENILVNDDLKLIYCYIPHVASKAWMKTFVYLKGVPPRLKDLYKPSFLSAFGFKRLGDYKEEHLLKRLNSYFKFVFVRDPLERVVSAFKSTVLPKTAEADAYRRKLANRMVNFNRNASEALVDTGYISFTDYAAFLADSAANNIQHDHHTARYSQLCLPCLIKYNAIGKISSIKDDVTYVLRQLYSDSCFETFRLDTISQPLPTTKKSEVANFYKKVPETVIHKLNTHYALDRQVFGL